MLKVSLEGHMLLYSCYLATKDSIFKIPCGS